MKNPHTFFYQTQPSQFHSNSTQLIKLKHKCLLLDPSGRVWELAPLLMSVSLTWVTQELTTNN
jgi:hypothetical protein